MCYVSREIHTRHCCCTVCATFDCNCHIAVVSCEAPRVYESVFLEEADRQTVVSESPGRHREVRRIAVEC